MSSCLTDPDAPGVTNRCTGVPNVGGMRRKHDDLEIADSCFNQCPCGCSR
jgi:hypothetical protein